MTAGIFRDAIGIPQPWMKDALCPQVGPELFFPDKGDHARDAKKVCLLCKARPDCLQYALDNDERFGVWGGLSERERRRVARHRRSRTLGGAA